MDRAEKANAAEKGQMEINHVIDIVQPHSLLLEREAPSGSLLGRLKSPGVAGKVGKEGDEGSFRGLAESFRFLRDRRSSLSGAIAKTLLAKVIAVDNDEEEMTEIDLKGLKVLVRTKTKEEEEDRWKLAEETALKGRISFYSRSNCHDCTSAFREKGLKFVKINVDVFLSGEKELIERTGNSQGDGMDEEVDGFAEDRAGSEQAKELRWAN